MNEKRNYNIPKYVDCSKAVISGKFIALSVWIKKLGKSKAKQTQNKQKKRNNKDEKSMILEIKQ